MLKVSVLYPYCGGTEFNIRYYCESHIPMVQKLLGAACVGVSVEHGLSGGEAGSPPAFIAMGHLFFDSIEAFMASFPPMRGSDHGRHPELHLDQTCPSN